MEYTTAEKLQIIMKRNNITMTELAKRLKQSRQNVSKKFQRNNFTENDLKSISEALEVDYFIEFKEREWISVYLQAGKRVTQFYCRKL